MMLVHASAYIALVVFTATNIRDVSATVYFEETFDTVRQWQYSADRFKGEFANEPGEYYGDRQAAKGLRTAEPVGKFYAISADFKQPFDNKGKTLVVSYTVQNPQDITCAGAYIKVLPAQEDPHDFDETTEYSIMFGPDICGGVNKIHLVFKQGGVERAWLKRPPAPEDKLTHAYTLIVHADDTYQVLVDGEEYEAGVMEDDFAYGAPRMIRDPKEKKPKDWVDAATVDDPTDKKPKGWDKEPAVIDDPNAVEPDDWDAARFGEWEPPGVPNPKYRGPWRPRQVPNPAYKGPWVPKAIPNPRYVPQRGIHALGVALASVGIDIWQVESGSVFDNIIVADSVEEVAAFNQKHVFAHAAAERKMLARRFKGASEEPASTEL